jgi:L-seryl-tRNA(Ser) seleniumtransferase
VDETTLGVSAFALSLALQQGEPPVHLGERKAAQGALIVNPVGLREGDAEVIATRLRGVLQEKSPRAARRQ